eukprot:1883327-Prorocentrum_lima.AAC.1
MPRASCELPTQWRWTKPSALPPPGPGAAPSPTGSDTSRCAGTSGTSVAPGPRPSTGCAARCRRVHSC